MPNQSTTIVDVVLVVLALVALSLVVLAALWRRWRNRRAGAQLLASATAGLQLPLTPEQERAVRDRIAELERQQAAPANGHAALVITNGAAVDWLGALVGAIHALILGQQRSGKTVIAHEVATRRARQGHQVLVADPDARPGMWPGCTVVGGGDDWTAIDAMLVEAQAEIAQRRQLRGRLGRRRFLPLTLVLSDAADIMGECEHARPVFEAALRRGGKLNVHLVIDVQDKQVGTLNIPGASHLLKNFDEEISVRRDGQRRIVGYAGLEYDVPQLIDPEELADAWERDHPLDTADADRLLSSLLAELQGVPVRAAAADLPPQTASSHDTGTNGNGGTQHSDAVPDDSVEVDNSEGVPALLTDEAIETLYKAWGSKNRVAAMLRGSKGKRLAQIDAALARVGVKTTETP
jgi:hypothetical protein